MKFYTNVSKYGKYIYACGRNENGEQVLKKDLFAPYLYVPGDGTEEALEGGWKSIDGVPLSPMRFDDMNDARDFLERYEGVSGFKVYGQNRFNFQWITENFRGKIDYLSSAIRIFFLDIEVYSDNGFPDPSEAKEAVTAITILDSFTNIYHIWGYKPYTVHRNDIEIQYHKFSNEFEMLDDFIRFWSRNYPDILTGWHSDGFDIPYLVNRIKRLFSEAKAGMLSPWGRIKERQFNIKGKLIKAYEIVGVASLDYLNLYKKFTLSAEESYKLEYIASKRLHKGKIKFEGSLHTLYVTDFQKYIEYNIRDVELVFLLEKLLRYIDLVIELTYIGKVGSYTDAIGTVTYWEVMIYNWLYERGIIAECKNRNGEDKDKKFEGAFVMEPVPGKYGIIASFDLTSLYPSIIRQVNIGVETKIDGASLEAPLRDIKSHSGSVESFVDKMVDTEALKEYNLSLSGNGQFYRRDKKSFFSEMIGEIFNQRQAYKKMMIQRQKTAEEIKRILKSRGENIDD